MQPGSKPKILFILHLPPPVHGAAMVGKYIQQSHIINEKFDTTYINLSTSTEMNEIGKGGANKLIATFKITAQVLKALLKVDFDLCYVTLTAKGFGYYKDIIIVTVLKAFRKKIIYHFHNKGISTRQDRVVDNILYRFTFKATKSIILSSLLYKDIAKYVKRDDIYVCPNGIPDLRDKLDTQKTVKVSDTNICKLLFLSNIVVEKGVLVLLEACKLLKVKNIAFECHFVGDWANVTEDMFNQLVIENNLSDRVFAHGKKYNDEKLFFYNSADIFVLPTFNECFPLVLLEAMQFSLPIVSTNQGGIAEIVSDGITGFIVPEKSAQELANKLELLIQNNDLRLHMGTAGRVRFENNFTLNHFEISLSDSLKQALVS